MDTGEHIGGRIRTVKGRSHGRPHILIRVNDRSEIRSIMEKGADDQADGHAGKEKGTDPVITVLICEQEKQDGRAYV